MLKLPDLDEDLAVRIVLGPDDGVRDPAGAAEPERVPEDVHQAPVKRRIGQTTGLQAPISIRSARALQR